MTTPKLSRRKFFLLVGGVCVGGGVVLAQKAPLTVNKVVERIKQRLGVKWGPNTVDTLKAGMDEFAAWLRPVVPEVPVKFIPAGDAFWIPKIDG